MKLAGDVSRLNGRRFPSKTAISCGDRNLTYGESDALANRIAQGLLAAGVRPGDRVALLALNCLEYLPLFFAVVKIGAICVPLNFRSTAEELGYMLDDCGAETLFYGPEFRDVVAALPRLARLVEIGPAAGLAGTLGLDRFIDAAAADAPVAAVDEADGAVIIYTSGTTGRPKGVVLSHRAVLDCSREIALATRITHDDVALVTVPLFHGGGLMVLSMPHLYLGARLVLTAKFDPAATVALLAAESVTTLFGVASQYAVLLDLPDLRRCDFGPLRAAWYGAAPMPVELLRRLRALWPGVGFFQLYGQTETTLVTALGPEEHATRLGVTGRELAGIEMRVVDDAGAEVACGAVGEVIVRRHTGMTGYFGNPEQTAEVIRGDWIHTGDLARLEPDGFITLVDRKRDVIISGGENIYPKEIEEVLYGHPSVLEAAVVGAADQRWGEVPCAYVVLRRGAAADAEGLRQWCAARLARYKLPRHWQFVEALPMTANGKIRKNVVRDWARERLPTGAMP